MFHSHSFQLIAVNFIDTIVSGPQFISGNVELLTYRAITSMGCRNNVIIKKIASVIIAENGHSEKLILFTKREMSEKTAKCKM